MKTKKRGMPPKHTEHIRSGAERRADRHEVCLLREAHKHDFDELAEIANHDPRYRRRADLN